MIRAVAAACASGRSTFSQPSGVRNRGYVREPCGISMRRRTWEHQDVGVRRPPSLRARRRNDCRRICRLDRPGHEGGLEDDLSIRV